MESNYMVLIGGCGWVGYLKKVFNFYNQMKKWDLEFLDVIYMVLFNVCVEFFWKDLVLQSVLKFWQQLQVKNFEFNLKIYYVLLKMVVKCVDFRMCFDVFKEIIYKGYVVIEEIFSFLFMGCI